MSVLVDTSVWSQALRRKNRPVEQETNLVKLISEGLVRIIGPIRQELLSGIVDKRQFNKLKKNLSHFHDMPLESSNFELAAEFSKICRKQGIQGSHTDFLICAVAVNYDLEIFTYDKDFNHFLKVLPIRLFQKS